MAEAPVADSLPTGIRCPYCDGIVPGYPALAAELAGDVPPALAGEERVCPRCGSALRVDGTPLRPHGSLLGPAVSPWLIIPLLLWLVYTARRGGDATQLAVILLVMVLLPAAELIGRREWWTWEARRRAAERRRELLAELGAGDPTLGERLLECDRRARPVYKQLRELAEQLTVVSDARDRIAESRFRGRVGAYQEAAALLEARIAARRELLRQFGIYRRDLEALVAARRAEEAFQPLDPFAEAATLDSERVRLAAEADALLAAAEVSEELRSLGIGPLPEVDQG